MTNDKNNDRPNRTDSEFGKIEYLPNSGTETAPERLQKLTKIFNDIMGSFADWYWETGPDHRFTFVGGPIKEHTQLEPRHYIGVCRWDVPGTVEPVDSPFWRQHMDDLNSHRPFRDLQVCRRRADGKLLYFSIDGIPAFDESGQFIGYHGVGHDVTDVVTMEEEASETAARYRDLVEGSIQSIIVHVDGKIVFVNQSAVDLFGYRDEAEMIELKDAVALFPPSERTRLEAYRLARLHGGEAPEQYETLGLRADGTQIWIENRVRRVNWSGRDGIQMTLQDVTEKRRALAELKSSEQRLAKILDIAADAIIHTDAQGRIILFNHGAERTFGYRADEIIGRNVDVLLPERFRQTHSRNIAAFNQSEEEVARRMGPNIRISGLDATGREFPAEASISRIELGGQTYFNVMVRDITERQAFEEFLIQAKTAAETANRAKSDFLAAMSHELRTPLNAILGFSDSIALETFGPIGNEKYREYISDIRLAGDQLLRLINSILDLSAVESGAKSLTIEDIDLSRLIPEAIRILERPAQEASITLTFDPEQAAGTVRADRQAMSQILWNLISNAIKYNRPGGTVTLSVSTRRQEVGVHVEDTGVGIPEDKIDEITKPFTKLTNDAYIASEGWGLGLSIVKALIEHQHGELEIVSTAGAGTTVSVWLPTAEVCSANPA